MASQRIEEGQLLGYSRQQSELANIPFYVVEEDRNSAAHSTGAAYPNSNEPTAILPGSQSVLVGASVFGLGAFGLLTQSFGGGLGSVDQIANRYLPSSVLGNNLLVPAVVLFGFFFIRRFIGGVFSIIPMAAIVLLMIGADSQAGQSVGRLLSGDTSDLGLGGGPDSTNLKILGVVVGYFVFRDLFRFRLPILLPVVAIGVLLLGRDYSLSTLLQQPGRFSVTTLVLAGIFILIALGILNRLVMRFRYPWLFPPLLSPHSLHNLKPIVRGGSLLLVVAVAALTVIKPAWLEQSYPGWQGSLGLGALVLAFLGLAGSLPQRYKAWAAPVCWIGALLVLAVQLAPDLRGTPSQEKVRTGSVSAVITGDADTSF